MKWIGLIVLIYGIVVLTGGLAGYLMADHIFTLIMGSLLGAVLIGGGCGIIKKSPFAYSLSLGTVLILFFSFTARIWLTGRISAVYMTALALIMLLTLLFFRKKV